VPVKTSARAWSNRSFQDGNPKSAESGRFCFVAEFNQETEFSKQDRLKTRAGP